MNKNITIIDVTIDDVPNAKGGYKKMNVAYKARNRQSGRDEVDAQALVSLYADKGVWAALEKAQKGDTFSVDLEKNEKGYWQWVGIHRQDAPAEGSQDAPSPRAFSSPTKPTYETPEERAQKQIYIIRQSSISSAVELLKDHGKQPDPEAVIKVARQFESYVMGTGIGDLTDDIPE